MADESTPQPKEAESSGDAGSIWQGLKSLLFGTDGDQTLRAEIEEAIDDYDEDREVGAAPASGGDLTPLERQMLRNLLHFSEHTVDDVAVPRADIIAIDEKASFAELVELFTQSDLSRIPVYRDTLDTIVGMIHVRDAFAVLATDKAPPKSLTVLLRQPLFAPQSMGVLDLLAEMRAKRTHLAIILDEYSGTDGLVTFEDLVEEIVGEVEDEHDDMRVALLMPLDDGGWEADARAELEEVGREIDPRLAQVDEDVDTIGGLAFVLAGHIPGPGEILPHPHSGWTLEVLATDGRRITRLRLHPPRTDKDGRVE